MNHCAVRPPSPRHHPHSVSTVPPASEAACVKPPPLPDPPFVPNSPEQGVKRFRSPRVAFKTTPLHSSTILHSSTPLVISPPASSSTSLGSGPEGRGAGFSHAATALGSSAVDAVGDLEVFMVSVCDGIGGGLLACASRTPNMQAHIVESDPHLLALVQSHFPHATSDPDILTLDIDSLISRINSCQWEVLLLIGGPPCQPFSHLGSQKSGFDDPRSGPLEAFIRIRNALRDRVVFEAGRREFCWLLEEVASMSAAHRDCISELVGSPPVLLNAADWGWVHRPRYYWGLEVDKLRSSHVVRICTPGQAAKDVTVIRWTGAPSPREWSPDGGCVWEHRSEVGVRSSVPPGTGFAATYPEGRFLIFTTVFEHPADRHPRHHANDPPCFQAIPIRPTKTASFPLCEGQYGPRSGFWSLSPPLWR